MFVSVTRLRIRSIRFMPFFIPHTLRALNQAKKAPGFQGGSLLPDHSFAFWTLTTWDTHHSMRQFMINGPHHKAMPHLLHWCDEASVVHWEQEEETLPTWEEADKRMREHGRPSKVNFPSPHHANLTYRQPRLTRAAPIHPTRFTTQ